jgi:hypothetical protein
VVAAAAIWFSVEIDRQKSPHTFFLVGLLTVIKQPLQENDKHKQQQQQQQHQK